MVEPQIKIFNNKISIATLITGFCLLLLAISIIFYLSIFFYNSKLKTVEASVSLYSARQPINHIQTSEHTTDNFPRPEKIKLSQPYDTIVNSRTNTTGSFFVTNGFRFKWPIDHLDTVAVSFGNFKFGGPVPLNYPEFTTVAGNLKTTMYFDPVVQIQNDEVIVNADIIDYEGNNFLWINNNTFYFALNYLNADGTTKSSIQFVDQGFEIRDQRGLIAFSVYRTTPTDFLVQGNMAFSGAKDILIMGSKYNYRLVQAMLPAPPGTANFKNLVDSVFPKAKIIPVKELESSYNATKKQF
jgi:hypothetical protein